MTTRIAERLTRLSGLQIDAIGAGVCALLGLAWYAVGFTPLAEARGARASLQQDLDVQREEAAHLEQVLKAGQRSLAAAKAGASSVNVTIESEDQLLLRVQALTAAAIHAGLRLDEIKPGAATPADRFTTVPIHLSGSGRFQAIAGFLHGLRSTYPDTGVVSLDLHGEPELSEKPAKFAFDLVWHALPLKAPANPPSQTAAPTTK